MRSAPKPFDVPLALKKALAANPAAKKAFQALAHSHRREYAQWIASAKKDETRERRLARAIPMLLRGSKTPMRADDAPAVSAAPVARKLGLEPGQTLVVLGAPKDVDLGALPEGAKRKTSGAGEVLLAFARDSKQLAALAPRALSAGAPKTWIAFPKKASGIPTDLGRDEGWEAVHRRGWRTVSLVALDGAWSAARVRPQ